MTEFNEGVAHCTYFRCCMNGANHLEVHFVPCSVFLLNELKESDSQPLHLCPVDLHKLFKVVGFDILERYKKLCDFYKEVGFTDELKWTLQRLKRIEEGDT